MNAQSNYLLISSKEMVVVIPEKTFIYNGISNTIAQSILVKIPVEIRKFKWIWKDKSEQFGTYNFPQRIKMLKVSTSNFFSMLFFTLIFYVFFLFFYAFFIFLRQKRFHISRAVSWKIQHRKKKKDSTSRFFSKPLSFFSSELSIK